MKDYSLLSSFQSMYLALGMGTAFYINSSIYTRDVECPNLLKKFSPTFASGLRLFIV